MEETAEETQITCKTQQVTYQSYLISPTKTKNSIKSSISGGSPSPGNLGSSSSPFKLNTLATFDPSEFVPKDFGCNPTNKCENLGQKLFAEQFYTYRDANKKQLYKQLISMAKNQILERLEKGEAADAPNILRQNRDKWAFCLIKDKRVQQVICRMTDELHAILNDELSTSSQLTTDYLHMPLEQLSSPSKKETQGGPSRLEYKSPTLKSSLDRAKEHISELEQKNRQEKEKAEREKALEAATNHVVKGLKSDHFKKARARPQHHQDKQQKVYNHPIQQEIIDRVATTKHLLVQLEQHEAVAKAEVKEIERDLQDIESSFQTKNPGEKITALLKQWSAEPVVTAKYIERWATELWKSREQFERELREEYSKIALMEQRLKAEYQDKVACVRKQAAFTIQAHEKACQQLKLKSFLEVQRVNMRLSEMESTLLSIERSDAQMNKDLELINSALDQGFDFDSEAGVERVKATIKTMQACILGLQQNITTQKQELKVKDTEKLEAEQTLENFTLKYFEACEMTQDYMRLFWQLADSTEVFGEDSALNPVLKKRFAEIAEMDQETTKLALKGTEFYRANFMNYLKEIKSSFEEIQLKQILDAVIDTWKSRSDVMKDLISGEDKLQKIFDRVTLTVTEQAEQQKRIRKLQQMRQSLALAIKEKIKSDQISHSDHSEPSQQFMTILEEEKFSSATESRVQSSLRAAPSHKSSLRNSSALSVNSSGRSTNRQGEATRKTSQTSLKRKPDNTGGPSSKNVLHPAAQSDRSKHQSTIPAKKLIQPPIATQQPINNKPQHGSKQKSTERNLKNNKTSGLKPRLQDDQNSWTNSVESFPTQQVRGKRHTLDNRSDVETKLHQSQQSSDGPTRKKKEPSPNPEKKSQPRPAVKPETQSIFSKQAATVEKSHFINKSSLVSQSSSLREEELHEMSKEIELKQLKYLLKKYKLEQRVQQEQVKDRDQAARSLSRLPESVLNTLDQEQLLQAMSRTGCDIFEALNEHNNAHNVNQMSGIAGDAIRANLDASGRIMGFAVVPEIAQHLVESDDPEVLKTILEKTSLLNQIMSGNYPTGQMSNSQIEIVQAQMKNQILSLLPPEQREQIERQLFVRTRQVDTASVNSTAIQVTCQPKSQFQDLTTLSPSSLRQYVEARAQFELDHTIEVMDSFIDKYRQEFSRHYKHVQQPSDRYLKRINRNIREEMEPPYKPQTLGERRLSTDVHSQNFRLPFVSGLTFGERAQSIVTNDGTATTTQHLITTAKTGNQFGAGLQQPWQQSSSQREPISSQYEAKALAAQKTELIQSNLLAKTLYEASSGLFTSSGAAASSSYQNTLSKFPKTRNQIHLKTTSHRWGLGSISRRSDPLKLEPSVSHRYHTKLRHNGDERQGGGISDLLRKRKDKVEMVLSKSPPAGHFLAV